MYSNYSQNNTFNPKLEIFCTMDMDCFEITKLESIKKYEENLYLLGKIFNIQSFNEKSKYETQKPNEPNKINNSIENEDEIINLFDKDNIEIDDNDDEQEEKIDNIINELNNKYKNKNITESNKKYLDELNIAYKQLKSLENNLDKSKISNKDEFKRFEDIVQKLKNVKSGEESNFYKEIIHQADNLGLINNLFKQTFAYNSINENKGGDVVDDKKMEGNIDEDKLDVEPPFGENENLLILPL